MTVGNSNAGVSADVRGHVGVLTINRPHVRNAIDKPTAEAIAATLDSFEQDSAIRAIVLTGAGGFFSAGMDLKALTATGERPITESRGAFGIVERPPAKPTIAAIEGAALGGGLEIALAADVIVVAADATLALPEVRRGLVAAAGGVLRLPNRIPRAIALEMIMTGAAVDAHRALALGLVNHVVTPGETTDRAIEIATQIAANAPMAVRAAKAVALASEHWTDAEGFTNQRAYLDPVRESADAREGAAAFVEKRTPVWQDS